MITKGMIVEEENNRKHYVTTKLEILSNIIYYSIVVSLNHYVICITTNSKHTILFTSCATI